MTARAAQSRRSGFTMVELLLGLALGAMLMVGIGYALQASIQSVRGNGKVIEARNQANTGMDFMLRTIRRAQSITVTDPTHLRVDSVDSAGNAIWTEFALANGNLMVKTQNTPASGQGSEGSILLSGVKKLKFTAPPGKNGGDSYKVIVGLTVNAPSGSDPDNPLKNVPISMEASSVARGILRNQNAGGANANANENANANGANAGAGNPSAN